MPDDWTTKEHETFLIGLEQYGQGSSHPEVWQKIATAVGTKTAAEVRTYAHNYFIKLQAESYTSQDVRPVHAIDGTLIMSSVCEMKGVCCDAADMSTVG